MTSLVLLIPNVNTLLLSLFFTSWIVTLQYILSSVLKVSVWSPLLRLHLQCKAANWTYFQALTRFSTSQRDKWPQRAAACSPKLPWPPLLDVSDWQTGQHSPSGMTIFSQLVSSSHWISSHRTWPLSQTQIRHGSGFQMSLLVYTWPSAVQLTSSPGTHGWRTRLIYQLCAKCIKKQNRLIVSDFLNLCQSPEGLPNTPALYYDPCETFANLKRMCRQDRTKCTFCQSVHTKPASNMNWTRANIQKELNSEDHKQGNTCSWSNQVIRTLTFIQPSSIPFLPLFSCLWSLFSV